MIAYIIVFLSTLIHVFAKGWQHQNVIGGHYMQAAATTGVLAFGEVAVVILGALELGWLAILPIWAGGAIGITFSMYLHRRVNNKNKKD
jgi:hypothetical protein